MEKKEKGLVAIEEKVLGPSSAQLQLRLDFRELDLNNIPKFLNYKVFWRGSVKERIFDIHKDIEIIFENGGCVGLHHPSSSALCITMKGQWNVTSPNSISYYR